ncbi:MFS transporter [Staphylococcus canis]|uniref:MFS transporter n=1 Tax=Staphylococcus canis TaxID=2724942 RepID=A0ABS0T7U8_9STAP|nr:MFS transporter [Staphylococcus canis]MBI5974837.1 MFS transporter [Staphylococcus canis]
MEETFKYNRVTTIFFITGIVVMCSLYTAIPMAPFIAKDFGISESTATLNGVAFSLAYSISCLLYGVISDKFGRIKIILIGLLGLFIISGLLFFVQTFTLFIVLRILQGIFAAAFSPVSLAYTTEMYPPVKRITAISFISTSFMLSGIIGQNLSEILAEFYSWRVTYLVLSILYVILVAIIFKQVPESPHRDPNVKITRFLGNFKGIQRETAILGCFFVSLTLLTNFISMYTLLSDYIESSIVQGDITTNFIVKLLGIIGMLMALLAGRLSDKFSVKRVLQASIVAQIITLPFMALTSNIIIITVLSIIFVGGIAIAIPSVISKIGMLADSNRGFYISVNTFILFLGTAIAPILSLQLEKLTHYFYMFSTLTIIAILAFIISTLIPKGVHLKQGH